MRPTDEPSRSSHSRAGLPAGTWSLAALSVAACLCSVLGAKLLSNIFEPAGAPAPAHVSQSAEPRVLAKSAPQAEAPASKELSGADMDFLPTGTIPARKKGRPALTPCGDAVEH
ncbi:MAG: hypothetical protein U1E25_13240 [Methylocystis sp.]